MISCNTLVTVVQSDQESDKLRVHTATAGFWSLQAATEVMEFHSLSRFMCFQLNLDQELREREPLHFKP